MQRPISRILSPNNGILKIGAYRFNRNGHGNEVGIAGKKRREEKIYIFTVVCGQDMSAGLEYEGS